MLVTVAGSCDEVVEVIGRLWPKMTMVSANSFSSMHFIHVYRGVCGLALSPLLTFVVCVQYLLCSCMGWHPVDGTLATVGAEPIVMESIGY